MDFHLFPVDEQRCEIKYESFGYTSKELSFAWLKDGSTVNPNITLAQFDLGVTLEDTYATDYYDLSYPGIIMKLDLTRLIGYHITQTYLPSVILVALAWLSLFISPESVPGTVHASMLRAVLNGIKMKELGGRSKMTSAKFSGFLTPLPPCQHFGPISAVLRLSYMVKIAI